jgi:hypothetical protein
VITLGGAPKKINLIAADLAGNISSLEFWIKRNVEIDIKPKEKTFQYFFPFNESNVLQTDAIRLSLPKGTLYENLYLQYLTTPATGGIQFSRVHHIHNNKTPVHNYFEIALKPDADIPAEMLPKSFIAYLKGNSITNCGGTFKQGFLTTKALNLGDYCVMADTVAPTVKPINFQFDMQKAKSFSFRIYDNFQTAGNVKGLTYHATIDGNWVLMEFDKKYSRLSHKLQDFGKPSEHQFRLVVKDALGNETVYENKFFK